MFDVELTLGDDLGTSYESPARSYGGSLERLRANWTFEPGPPDSVASLTVAVAGDGIEKTAVRVAL